MALKQDTNSTESDGVGGNEPSSPKFGPEQLREAEKNSVGRGGGSSSSTAGGKINYGGAGGKLGGSSPLSSSTSPGKIGYGGSDDIPQAERSLYNSSPTAPGQIRYLNLLSTRRRKVAFGGGLIGTIVGLVLGLSVIQGPLQFVHFAQLLQQFHFSGLQSQQDDRFMKEVRFIRYASKGEIEKTRLGLLGNKFTNTFESKLNTSGLVSTYSDRFGQFNGYTLDRTSDESPFRGLSDKDAIIKAQEIYGVDAVRAGDAKIIGLSKAVDPNALIVDASKLGYKDTFKMNYGVLRSAGYNKISAAIGARLLCVRAACTSLLHPLTKLVNSRKATLDERLAARNRVIEDGSQAQEITDTKGAPADTDPAKAPKDIADQTVTEEQQKAKGPIGDFKASINGKLALGGAAAIGVLCMVKSVNDNAGEIKQAQVVLPLIRIGMEIIGVGNQVMSGQDIDLNELNQYSKYLSGKDSSGNTTSWTDSQSIQANSGHPNSGVAPNSTLTSIGKGSPFSGFLDSVGAYVPLGTICNTGVQAGLGVLTIALDFTGVGAAVNALTGAAVQGIAQGVVLDQITNWLAGKAINPEPVGADYGNAADYGATLAANDQSIGAGGSALSAEAAAKIQSYQNVAWQQQFSQESLAHKLFSPTDDRSAISSIIDKTSPSFTQNLNKMAAGLLNFGHIFSVIPNLFSAKAHAAGTPYNYGFPIFGFTEAELDNKNIQNPYENACYIAGCPEKNIASFLTDTTGQITTRGQGYIDEAKKCFGVTIAQDTTGQWGVSSGGGDSAQYDKIPSSCSDGSDVNWLRLRFFILDTETMNSMGCYSGDDEACTDIGFGNNIAQNTATPSTPPATPAPSGDLQQLAKQILASSNVSYPLDATSPNGSTKAVLQAIAAGKPAPVTCRDGSAGNITSANLNPAILQMIVDLAAGGKVGVNALTDKCHTNGSNHYKGMAVDFECKAVLFDVAQADTIAAKYGGKRNSETCSGNSHWHYDFLTNG